MKRLAIFVEGQTEQIFVSKLLREIAGKKNILVEEQIANGRAGKRFITVLKASSSQTNEKYFVLIRDCRNDGICLLYTSPSHET